LSAVYFPADRPRARVLIDGSWYDGEVCGAGRGRVLALVVLLGVASPMTSRLVVATTACPASPRRRVGEAQVVSSRIAEQTHVFGRF